MNTKRLTIEDVKTIGWETAFQLLVNYQGAYGKQLTGHARPLDGLLWFTVRKNRKDTRYETLDEALIAYNEA
jgi:hypothetical protein